MMKQIVISSLCLMALAGCERVATVEDVAEPADQANVAVAQEWTTEAFAALSGRLLEVIQTDGHVAAIGVCSMEASGLLDRVAEARGGSIRRVTDRPRNPANQGDARDLEVMEMMRKMIGEGTAPAPVVDGRVVRLPIRIALPLCLTCHGDPAGEIAGDTLAAIRERYPNDLATGYREGDFRGLWRVEMPEAPPKP
jgi:hypothetical protein